jgi:hypothetical protein
MMELDLPNPETFSRWLPAPKTLETGQLLLSWDVQFESPAGVDKIGKLLVDLKYRDVDVRLSWSSVTRCSIDCRVPFTRDWSDLRNSGYRALVALDRYVGRVASVNGFRRSECWILVLALYVVAGGPQAYDMTELMKSAQSGDVENVKALVENGADVNATDLIGTTALFRAAESGALESFRWLLDHGANPQAMTADGCTPLHSAAISGNTDIIRSLIGLRVDLNKATMAGRTALGLAVIHRQVDAVKALLSAGADPKAERGNGYLSRRASQVWTSSSGYSCDLWDNSGRHSLTLSARSYLAAPFHGRTAMACPLNNVYIELSVGASWNPTG